MKKHYDPTAAGLSPENVADPNAGLTGRAEQHERDRHLQIGATLRHSVRGWPLWTGR